ncbi:MAG: aconitate hydratase B, partial [Holophagae bacterium]|nr:aconitate hydratase B [Holophagae bacterium]
MIQAYRKHTNERKEKGIPPLPLTPSQAQKLCQLLENPPEGEEKYLLNLLVHHISPGVDPAAKVKADWLNRIACGETGSPVVSPADAVRYLGTMLGGYNIEPLISHLSNDDLGDLAATALKHTILIYNAYDRIVQLSATNHRAASILQSWADAEWFTSRAPFPDEFTVKVFKVKGETNTDDFSPAKDAWSRSDIPFHSLCMGESRFPEGLDTIRKFREEGFQVAFVGDVVGTGSSRKSACNSVMWHIGDDTPFVPNKRRAGIVLGNLIAPIFFNTAEDSGGLPILCDVTMLKTGDVVTINTKESKVFSSTGETLTSFEIKPATLRDEFRAGGRLNLIIGRSLTQKARKTLNLSKSTVFIAPDNPTRRTGQGYSLAQKIVGKACGLPGILPGTACEPSMATVGSQDTTG